MFLKLRENYRVHLNKEFVLGSLRVRVLLHIRL